MIVLALDLATCFGFAIGDISSGEKPEFGHKVLPSTGDDIGRFLLHLDDWLNDKIVFKKPDLVVFEAPILTRGRTTKQVAMKLMNLAGHTEFFCSKNNIRALETNIGSIKKYFTNNGAADKAAMVEEARSRGFNVKVDDEADALAIYFQTMHKLFPEQAQKWDARSTARLI